MTDLFHLFRRGDYAFGEEKSGSEIRVVARRPHRDRDRFMDTLPAIVVSDADLERFLDRQCVVELTAIGGHNGDLRLRN
jgi:hypothetical protein